MTAATTTIEPICPNCGYCLRGIAARGRCPECGNPYEMLDLSLDEICANFERAIPAHERMFMRIRRIDRRFPWTSLAMFVVGSVALTCLFIGAQVLATNLAFEYPVFTRRTVFSSYNCIGESATWWDHIKYDDERLLGTGMWVFVAQIMVSPMIWVFYLFASLRARSLRRIIRRLGLHTVGSVWSVTIPGMFVVSLWQFVNVQKPTWVGGSCCLRGLFESLILAPGLTTDRVQLSVLVGLVIVGLLAGLATYRRHRTALAEVIDALNGVRALPPDQSDNPDSAARSGTTPA